MLSLKPRLQIRPILKRHEWFLLLAYAHARAKWGAVARNPQREKKVPDLPSTETQSLRRMRSESLDFLSSFERVHYRISSLGTREKALRRSPPLRIVSDEEVPVAHYITTLTGMTKWKATCRTLRRSSDINIRRVVRQYLEPGTGEEHKIRPCLCTSPCRGLPRRREYVE